MCNHASLEVKKEKLQKRYKAKLPEPLSPVYHAVAFSHQRWPILRQEGPSAFAFYHWGLVPRWVKDSDSATKIRAMTVNAVCETVFEKPAFRGAITGNRCLIPCTGFYEWQHRGKIRIPHFIHLPETEVFSIAGLYDSWVDAATGEIVNSFTMLTVPANELMSEIHNSKKRMPLILPESIEKDWLKTDLGREEIGDFFKPFPSMLMEAYPIGKLISDRSADSNVPQVKSRVPYPATGGVQTSLF